jgi:hypothetical protein
LRRIFVIVHVAMVILMVEDDNDRCLSGNGSSL